MPALLVAAVLGAAACRGDGPKAGGPAPAAPGPAAPREVRTEPATESSLPRVIVATGTLAADEQIVLGPKVAGRVLDIGVDLGSVVARGQVVARLDPTDWQLQVAQAEAALQQGRARLGLPPDSPEDRVDAEQTPIVRQARAVLEDARLNRERMTRLWQQDLVARAQLDTAIAALQVAESRYEDAIEEVRTRQAVLAQRRSELALARQNLADTVLRSPLDGAVRERHVAAGQYLAVGAPVVTLVRMHPLRLRVAVPEREAAGIRIGQVVRVSVEGDAAVHPGRVARLSPAIQEQSRTLLIEAEVPNERGTLRPGAFGKAEITTGADSRVVTVPASAIVTFAGLDKVLAVRDGRTEERRVRTGRQLGARMEILEGLAAGEVIVAQPGNLTGGQPVVPAR